ncbi:MAG: sugar-binding protein [Armatimonadota bacterium]
MFRIISVLVMLTLAMTVQAAEFVKTSPQYLILKPKAPIVIDGKLTEWDMAAAQAVINPEETKNPLIKAFADSADPIKGKADISGRIAVAWDAKYLYFACAVTDDHLLGAKPDSLGNQGPAPWGCDSVMINMNSFRQPMKRNNPYSNDVTLGLRYAPAGDKPRGALVSASVLDTRDQHWKITPNGKWAVTETPTGYAVEAAIPWSDLAYVPRVGDRLFIAIMLPDVDPGQGLKQLGWGFGGSMNTYPVFRLSERSDALGIITLSADEVATDAAWAVRTEIDARTMPVKLDRLRIITDDGKVALERSIGLDVPKGMTGIDLRSFSAGELRKPGRYTIEALLSAPGGAVVITRQPLRIVLPTPDPPMVQNPSGEINHMRPSRVAHNAWDLHQRGLIKHHFVKGKDDYIPFIKKYAEPSFITDVRGQIDGKGPWGYGYLLQCLAFYKVTGNEEYVKLGRDLMDYELTRALSATETAVSGGPADAAINPFKLLSFTGFRYYTWLKDPNSPFAPKDAEKRYRAMFYPIAAKPDKYYFDEWGTHNRIWHRYSILQVARQIAEEDGKPIDPRVIAYTDFHAKLLESTGDDDDASSGYNWGWFHYPLAMYFHQGDLKPLLTNPGYVKTISRYAETISPGGVMPTYGADGSWPSFGASIWTFELMASVTRDGRYRWAAHRVAECLYNYLYADATQYHLPADGMKSLFLMGYFYADDSITPTPPPTSSRLVWRHPLVEVPVAMRREHPGMGMIMDAKQLIPEKLVLSSGNDASGLWGMVELLPLAGHGGSLPGNLITLIKQDSALLAGQGYYEQSANFQNILWVEDLDGLIAVPHPVTVSVPVLAEDAACTFLRVQTNSYQQLPLTYTRDVVFSKAGFVVVKDRAKFDSTMKVRLGPCFQTRNIGPRCGENWFNTYYDEMYTSGLGLGRGVQSFFNPPWDLLVYFSPRPGRKQTVHDTYPENPFRQSPIRLRQEWAGMTAPGQELTFTTVLLPHAPTLTPQHLLQPPPESKDTPRIQIIRDDNEVTVLKVVTMGDDPWGRQRNEHWVLLNNTGTLINAGLLESDAQMAMIRLSGDGKLIEDRVIIGGTVLRVNGIDEMARTRKCAPSQPVIPDTLQK